MRKNRGKNIYYVTHRDRWAKADGHYSYLNVLEDGVIILRHRPLALPCDHVYLDRRHARLLAKRLLQALEDTK